MKKEYRIKKKSEIDAVFQKRNQNGNRYFQIYADFNQTEKHFRFALSIGKKYGNAVMRNKMKRQLRAIVNDYKEHLREDALFVIVVKKAANELTYQEIKKIIDGLITKTKLKEQ